MVLKWLAGSGGIQVFPPVVALAQMRAGLCNCTPPLRAQSRWLHETRCEQIKQKVKHSGQNFQAYTHTLDTTAWFFRRCSIFPTPHWSKWSCCRFFLAAAEWIQLMCGWAYSFRHLTLTKVQGCWRPSMDLCILMVYQMPWRRQQPAHQS